MAIDPDVQPLLDALDARITTLEASPGGNDQAMRDAISRYNQRFYAALEGKTDAEVITLLDGVTF